MQFKYILLSFKVILLNKVIAKPDVSSTTKTHDLETSNSDSIHLIETEPLWERKHHKILLSTERPWGDLKRLSIRPKHKTAERRRNDQRFVNEDNYTEEDDHNSSEELKKFLKTYAEQFRRSTTRSPVIGGEYESSEKFNKIELITKPTEEPTNRLANLFLEDSDKDVLNIGDKSKSWNLLNVKRHKHPLEEDNGWVSMDVVPWSVSKVAKWHSNALKHGSEEKPWPNYPSHSATIKPVLFSKPVSPYNPRGTAYDSKLFNYNLGNLGNTYNKPNLKPSYNVPTTTYAQKVYLQPQDYDEDIPKPVWNKNRPQLYHIHQNKDEDCEQGNNDGIITDGLPPNFPKTTQDYNRRKSSMGDNEHPASYPFHGDGEWVLLSTTKGYKSPNIKQRSLDIDVVPYNDATSISTHKSVRLTVLPPLKNSKINMTTSHGGLLQVESTFQTVDEAQKIAAKKEILKKKPGRRRPAKQALANTVNAIGTVTPAVNTRNRLSHASSVLAAVGAGMIPATMAMLVPMAMGRRRRRRRDLTIKGQADIRQLKKQLPRFF